ncbi:bifunctional methylenetetrahydrofolate dehydrogenase/methenyltetrahydrofolate cyclohydrolase FolD [Legionella gresilensis]|uniref:bifunctional methylenetetrahydrofolate dehydrogenase/methenyltetrahydrofolate cyclohydrolase FolD n=1 Tax=Legionella gresilensis TaxID=91823 RepID=UPI0010416EAF|nr:bifunctional methylenetetrahydrofolate dehydrogenase/methenyltetrahydrofolate cyclohydrolase FolD [Legionella gresilensis]
MKAILLNGRQLASKLRTDVAQEISARKKAGITPPALAVILVGDDPASEIYVTNKRRACEEAGITSVAFNLPGSTKEEKLVDLIQELNLNNNIDGILVQFPLPTTIDSDRIIECIAPSKDVDGFHPYNVGRLAQRIPLLRPCTPFGIIQLLDFYDIPLRGKNAVVIGSSNIVGRPMALEFLLAGATVTVCHRFTTDLEPHVKLADIIVVATGVCDLIEPHWLSKSQVVIDVGIHRLDNGKLRGDINFDAASLQVGWITPVPGGVGPMTIATLLQNTLQANKQQRKELAF